MCTHKLNIRHPSKDFKLSDPIRLTVPCGVCYECRRNKASDIEMRIYHQLVWNKKNGFRNYFVTLTYDDFNLPRIQLPSGNFVEVFDRDVWRNFISNLQKQLKRKYGIGKKGGLPPINYMVCSEKGGKYGRPHHHVVIGCHGAVEPYDLYQMVKHYWQGDPIGKDDQGNELFNGNGFIFPRYCFPSASKKGFEICGDPGKAAKYVAKYVCKDLSFYQDNQELAEYIDYYKSVLKNTTDENCNEYCEAEEILQDLKKYMPFWSCTQHFGECIIDEIKGSTDLETLENIKQGLKIMRYDKKIKSYVPSYRKVPMYILRKMLYDIRYIPQESNILIRYDINSLGLLYKQFIYNTTVENVEKSLRNAFVLAKLNQFERVKPYQSSDIDFHLLSVYKLTFKDRILPYLYKDSYEIKQKFDFNVNNIDDINAIAPQYQIIDPIRNINGMRLDPVKEKFYYNKTFNTLPVFRQYDVLLDILDEYMTNRSKITSDIKKTRESKNQKIRHLCLDNFSPLD